MQAWGDMNQSTLRLVCNCFSKEWTRDELIDLVGRLGYSLPDCILDGPQYARLSVCTVQLRELVQCETSVGAADACVRRRTRTRSSC